MKHQHEIDEQLRDAQLISRLDVLTVINDHETLYHKKMQVREQSEQHILGNFLTTFMMELKGDIKTIEIKKEDPKLLDIQLRELYVLTGCVNISQLIELFRKLENQQI